MDDDGVVKWEAAASAAAAAEKQDGEEEGRGARSTTTVVAAFNTISSNDGDADGDGTNNLLLGAKAGGGGGDGGGMQVFGGMQRLEGAVGIASALAAAATPPRQRRAMPAPSIMPPPPSAISAGAVATSTATGNRGSGTKDIGKSVYADPNHITSSSSEMHNDPTGKTTHNAPLMCMVLLLILILIVMTFIANASTPSIGYLTRPTRAVVEEQSKRVLQLLAAKDAELSALQSRFALVMADSQTLAVQAEKRERKHAGLVKDLEALERAEVARLTKRSGGDPAEAAADRQRLDLHARVADLLEQLAVAGVEASRQRKLNAALSEKCEAMESAASRDAISRSTADRAMQALHKEFEDLRVEMVRLVDATERSEAAGSNRNKALAATSETLKSELGAMKASLESADVELLAASRRAEASAREAEALRGREAQRLLLEDKSLQSHGGAGRVPQSPSGKGLTQEDLLESCDNTGNNVVDADRSQDVIHALEQELGPLRDRLLQCEAKLRSTEIDARRRLVRTKEHATDAAFRLEAALDAALVGEQHAVALSASRAEQLKMLAAARAKEQTAAAQKQAALHTEHALSQAKVSKLAATVVGLQRELAASAAARDRMAARESQAVARLHKLELAQAVGPVSSARPHAADAGATAASTGMRGASSAPPSAPSSSTAAHLELVGEVAELRKHAANADAEIAGLIARLEIDRDSASSRESALLRREAKETVERKMGSLTSALNAAQLTVGELQVTVEERNRQVLELERACTQLQRESEERLWEQSVLIPPNATSAATMLGGVAQSSKSSNVGGSSNSSSRRNAMPEASGGAVSRGIRAENIVAGNSLWRRVESHLSAQEPLNFETLAAAVWRLTWRNTAVERLAAWALEELETATVNGEAFKARLHEATLDLQRKDVLCHSVVQQQVVASLQKNCADLSLQLGVATATIARRDHELEQAHSRETWALKRARLLQRLSPMSSTFNAGADAEAAGVAGNTLDGDGYDGCDGVAGIASVERGRGRAGSSSVAAAAAANVASGMSKVFSDRSKMQDQQRENQLGVLRELLLHETSIEAALARQELAVETIGGSSSNKVEHVVDQVAALEALVVTLAATNDHFAHAIEVVLSGKLPPADTRERARQVLAAAPRSLCTAAPRIAAHPTGTPTVAATAKSTPTIPKVSAGSAPPNDEFPPSHALGSTKLKVKAKAKARAVAAEKRAEAAAAAKIAASQLAALKAELAAAETKTEHVEVQCVELKRERDRDRARKDALIQGLRDKLAASQAEVASAHDASATHRGKLQRLETKRGGDHAVIAGLRQKVEQLSAEAGSIVAHRDLLSESRSKASQLQDKLARKAAQAEAAVAKCTALAAELAARDEASQNAKAAAQAQKKSKSECKRLRNLLAEADASRAADATLVHAQEVQIAQLKHRNTLLQTKTPPKKPASIDSETQTNACGGGGRGGGRGGGGRGGGGRGGGMGGGGDDGGRVGGADGEGRGASLATDDVIDNVKAILNLTDAEYAALVE
eukprot:gene1125-19297_t